MKEQHPLSPAYSPLSHVRLGSIGLGRRGLRTIQRYRYIEGATIVALSDIHPERIREAQALLGSLGCPEAKGYGREQIPQMLHSGEVDLVLICTDWYSHVPLACSALEAGLHVAVEVPAGATLLPARELLLRSLSPTYASSGGKGTARAYQALLGWLHP